MKVRGVAFHVGSGGSSLKSYMSAIDDARRLFNLAEELDMPKFDLLNIGGGFSCDSENYNVKENNFRLVAPKVAEYIKKVFPEKDIQVVGEPGRYIC